MDTHGQVISPLPPFVPMGEPFQRLFGTCRSTQAQLIQNREIRSVLVGAIRGRRMIETASFLEYLERQRQREAAGEIGGRSPNPRARKRQPAAAPAPARNIKRPQPTARRRQQHRSSPGPS